MFFAGKISDKSFLMNTPTYNGGIPLVETIRENVSKKNVFKNLEFKYIG